jgi:ABC-type transport system involved in multi-copper enzyme maturation permease subunit
VAIQTAALFVDAYRELRSKRLFWITLTLSAAVMASLAIVGINDRGLTFFGKTLSLPFLNTNMIPETVFYKWVFTVFYVRIWLAWGAMILALVSVSGIFPDFLAGGAVELTLSKPIGRARLYLTRFASGLLFALLQSLVFAGIAFVVIGLRAGAWEWRLFLAVPILLLFFSFLFSVNALMGLLTRSTIASLLLTLLFWALCFAANITDNILVGGREAAIVSVENLELRVGNLEKAARKTLEAQREKGVAVPPASEHGFRDDLEYAAPQLAGKRRELVEAREDRKDWTRYARWLFALKTALPKTQETLALLDNSLLSPADYEAIDAMGRNSGGGFRGDGDRVGFGSPEAQQRAQRVLRSRPFWWVFGTSVCFVAAVLGLGSWIFSRRDF